MDVTAAFVFFVMALPIVGLMSDNRRLRKRNAELDRAGGKLAEDYIRARAQLALIKPRAVPRRAHVEPEPGSVLLGWDQESDKP